MMTPNLRNPGLAILAMLAISAVAASSAQATNAKITTNAGGYPATLTGTQVGTPTVLKIGNGVRSVHCEATFTSVISAPANHFTATPVYTNCTASGAMGGSNATITMNGCLFTWRTTSTLLEGTTANASTELVCAGGNKIEVHLYETAATHEAGKALCTYDISPIGKPYNGTVTLHNKPEDVEAQISLKEIPTLNTIGPVLLCGGAGGAIVNSTWTGNKTIQATVGGVAAPVMIG